MTGFRKNCLDLHSKVTEDSPIPLHIQLTEAIMQELRQRSIAAGTSLPPILSLSETLKLNRDTVRKAYVSLEKDHVIQRLPGGRIFSVTEEFCESVAKRQLTTIGIVLPDRMEELLLPATRPALEVVSGIMDTASDFGIAGMIVPLPEQRDELSRLSGWLEQMIGKLDGLIYLGESVGHCHDKAFEILLSKTDIPQVFIFGENRFREHLGLVQVDLESGFSGAMEYLNKRFIRRIAVAAKEIPVRRYFQLQTISRMEMLKSIVRGAPAEWCLLNANVVSAKKHFSKVFSASVRPQAVFCDDYEVAEEVLAAAQEMKIKVPEDLEIICYGSSYEHKCISEISHPFRETGRAAVRMITASRRKSLPVSKLDTVLPTVFRPAER